MLVIGLGVVLLAVLVVAGVVIVIVAGPLSVVRAQAMQEHQHPCSGFRQRCGQR